MMDPPMSYVEKGGDDEDRRKTGAEKDDRGEEYKRARQNTAEIAEPSVRNPSSFNCGGLKGPPSIIKYPMPRNSKLWRRRYCSKIKMRRRNKCRRHLH